MYILQVMVDETLNRAGSGEIYNRLYDAYCNAGKDRNMKAAAFETSYEGKEVVSSNDFYDAGFDLFTVHDNVEVKDVGIATNRLVKVRTGVRCAMYKIEEGNKRVPVSYYLYPRSSVGTKTRLRLANSVGIIDSGYRGEIMGIFDYNGNGENVDDVLQSYFEYDEETKAFARHLQICAPDLGNFKVEVLKIDENDHNALLAGNRGFGGFGSSGR